MGAPVATLDVRDLLGEVDEGRARLIAAAIATFAAKGFHGTSTRDIAAAAGMSPAAVYVHHRSKEALLHVISKAGHERILRLIEECLDSSPDPVTRLGAVMEAYAAAHARGHTVARIVNYDLRALSGEHYAEIAEIRRATTSRVRSLVAEGARAGVFRVADVDITTLALLSLGIDVARWYRDGGGWTPELVGARYRELALRMVGATCADRRDG